MSTSLRLSVCLSVYINPFSSLRDNDNKATISETPKSQMDSSPDPPGFSQLSKGLMLGIAYSANIGGTATLTGTGPNLILSGDISK